MKLHPLLLAALLLVLCLYSWAIYYATTRPLVELPEGYPSVEAK